MKLTIDVGKVLTSKTLWANIILLGLGVADVLSNNAILPPKEAIYITAIVIPILNVFLRFLTNDALVTKQ